MSKTGISLFSALTQNFRSVITKAVAYTVLLTDEMIQINGAYTMTVFDKALLAGTNNSKKILGFKNVHATAVATVAAATGCTIGGRASINLNPGEALIIAVVQGASDCEILWPSPMAAGLRNIITLVKETSGTTPQNVIDATGCPVVGQVVSIVSHALDATAGNILIKNTNGTIDTIAKGTAAGVAVSATTLVTPQMAVGDLLTVESSATNGNSRVVIQLSTQTLTS